MAAAEQTARRRFTFLCSCIAINLLASCAHKTGVSGMNDIRSGNVSGPWAGRISLKIQSDPPQSFFAGFELSGQAEGGELTLTNPLGGVIGLIRWTASSATLEAGQAPRQFASIDELLSNTTGASIPIAALFDWLAGKQTSLDGWTADLSEQMKGRILAIRLVPTPQAELRLILDQ